MASPSLHLTFTGLYTIPEAARILAVTPPLANGHPAAPVRLRYWIRTSITPVSQVALPSARRLITFKDLISMRLIALLRAAGVSLPDIRKTENWMKETLNIDWPFVSRPLWTYASNLYIEFEKHLIAASLSGQQAMEFMRGWLSKVELDMTFNQDDLVSSWSPRPHIRLDPEVQFGEPCIDGTRIPTRALWSKIKAGDTLEVVAALYEIGIDKVQRAIEWEERLVAA